MSSLFTCLVFWGTLFAVVHIQQTSGYSATLENLSSFSNPGNGHSDPVVTSGANNYNNNRAYYGNNEKTYYYYKNPVGTASSSSHVARQDFDGLGTGGFLDSSGGGDEIGLLGLLGLAGLLPLVPFALPFIAPVLLPILPLIAPLLLPLLFPLLIFLLPLILFLPIPVITVPSGRARGTSDPGLLEDARQMVIRFTQDECIERMSCDIAVRINPATGESTMSPFRGAIKGALDWLGQRNQGTSAVDKMGEGIRESKQGSDQCTRFKCRVYSTLRRMWPGPAKSKA